MSYTVSYFYRFGDFVIDLEQRVLLRDNRPVPLTPKVFDTLLVLVEHHGRIVAKDELMDRLWPDSFVEESNLIFNIQHLRKALGDNARHPRYVETVAKRGYRFIAEVHEYVGDGAAAVTQSPDRGSPESQEVEQNGTVANVPARLPGQPTTKLNSLRSTPSTFNTVVVTASLLLVGSLFAWQFAHSKGNAGKSASTGNGATPPNLKLEKLTDTGKNKHAVISPDGQYVAYTFDAQGQHGIWLRELATGAGTEIVPLSERLGGLAFAHSGKYLYFIKGPAQSQTLYRIGVPLGGVPSRVVEKPEGTYSISPDDSRIAFVRYSADDKRCALMISDADGQNERAIAVHDQPDRFNSPAWSPDGKSVAVAVGPSDSGGQQVRIVEFNVTTGSEKELRGERWFHIARILWLPDQSGLLMIAKRTLADTKRLWRINYPNGEVTPVSDELTGYADVSLTADATRAVAPQISFTSNIWIGPARPPQPLKRITHAAEDFSWTPDGRIVYASQTSIKPQLWIMRPDGSEQKQLTYHGEYNSSPAVTADGRYIVFRSNRTGTHQIWRIDIDGGNPTQLTKGSGSNFPTISPDGRSVLYNNVDDWSLWKVPIGGGEPVRLIKNYAIYPSVSPDGKLIACVGKRNDKVRQLLILSAVDGKIQHEISIGSLKLSAYRLRWTADGRSLLFAASDSGVASIYKQPLTGSVPEKILEFDEDDIYDFAYSVDGQQLAVTRGGYQFDVVLLSGLNR